MQDPFDFQVPTPEALTRMALVRAACKALRDVLEAQVPAGRLKALAMTNLEQAAMWANKGIVSES